MPVEEIRVGLIGAGGKVRNRHIPGFDKVQGVDITTVPFDTGVHYMEWTEAPIRSADSGQAVCLLL